MESGITVSAEQESQLHDLAIIAVLAITVGIAITAGLSITASWPSNNLALAAQHKKNQRQKI